VTSCRSDLQRLPFDFSGDWHAAPDLRRMEKLLEESFSELRNAAAAEEES